MLDVVLLVLVGIACFVGGYVSSYTMQNGYWPWNRPRPGCCTSCSGTGFSGDEAVPGGMCWDCKATGHPHAGSCRRNRVYRLFVYLTSAGLRRG